MERHAARVPWEQVGLALAACGTATAAALAVPLPAVLAGAGLLPLLLIFAFHQPFLLCLAFIGFSFFRLHEAFMALTPWHLPQVLAVATLLVLATHVLLGRTRLAWTAELRLFAGFFLLVTLGCAVASDRAVAFGYWADTFAKIAVMVFAIASLATTPRDFARASLAFVVCGMLIAACAIANHATGIGLVEGSRVTIGRSTGSVLGDPNDLALVLLFPLSFAVALAVTRGTGWPRRALGLAGIGCVVIAILDTGSRGGLLGMLAVLGVFAALRIRARMLLLAIAALAIAGLLLATGLGGRLGQAAGGGLIDESSQGRLHAWGAAWRMALARPLTGVGLNCYVANYYFYQDWWEGFAKAVHSTWFAVLAETGFPGLLVFAALVIATLRSAWRSVRMLDGGGGDAAAFALAQAVLAGMAGFVVSGSFLTQAFTWPLYVLLGLAVAVARFAGGEAD